MLRVPKAKTARSKRALQAKEAKLVENVKTAVFAKGSSTSGTVNDALKDLLQLKKPDGLMFAKKNDIRPFEDATTFEFWSQKNDAAFVVFGRHSKKRPHDLVIARMFEHQVMEMLELGIERGVPLKAYKTPKSALGVKPAFVFAGDLFETHPLYVQLKNLLVDLFHGEIADQVNLAGLEHVISVTCAPIGAQAAPATLPTESIADEEEPVASTSTAVDQLPLVHFRVYTVKLLKSGRREPRVDLVEMGPALDLRPRRSQPANEETWKKATTLKVAQATKRRGEAKRQNLDVNEMGDKVGRIHVGRQDLSKLQSRKMKGLKTHLDEASEEDQSSDEEERGAKRAKR